MFTQLFTKDFLSRTFLVMRYSPCIHYTNDVIMTSSVLCSIILTCLMFIVLNDAMFHSLIDIIITCMTHLMYFMMSL